MYVYTHSCTYITFLVAVTKRIYFGSQVYPILPTKVQWQGHGVANHTVSVLRKQKDVWCLACFLLFIQCRTQSQKMMSLTLRVDPPASARHLWTYPQRPKHRFVSWESLNPFKIAIKIICLYTLNHYCSPQSDTISQAHGVTLNGPWGRCRERDDSESVSTCNTSLTPWVWAQEHDTWNLTSDFYMHTMACVPHKYIYMHK